MVFSNGSEWRKWDLHVHTKGTLKEDRYESPTFENFCVHLFKTALENEIAAIGITDYFSIENYKRVIQFVKELDEYDDFNSKEKEQIKKIFLIPNVELRMLPSTDSGRLINIHCLFNPDFVPSLENHFFNSLDHSGGSGEIYKMNRQGMIDLGKSNDPNLGDDEAYIKGVSLFVVAHNDLQKLKDSDSDFRENVLIAVSNSNKDGASGLQKHYDLFEGKDISCLDGVRGAIYKISDCIFSGNPKDAEYFSGQGVDDYKTVAMKCGTLKPCIHGSDAHTEEKLFAPDENRNCWIKADLTFNGLKQILYEPSPKERVYVGQTKPDRKDGFKVIKRIIFQNTNDFPNEIVFNSNLCSIIGSRSSGKSALLAYIADSIDHEQTYNKRPNGPGEGFSWEKVYFDYSVEWTNGCSNEENPGKVVYIPQNNLYEISGKKEEIKNKILPVLKKWLPQIESKYSKVENGIKDLNDEIGKLVEKWFIVRDQIEEINKALKDLGTENAILMEINYNDKKISDIKIKFKLEDTDFESFQKLSEETASLDQKKSQINEEICQIGEEGEYFNKAEISLKPSYANFPNILQTSIDEKLNGFSCAIINDLNAIVSKYVSDNQKELLELNYKITGNSQELEILKAKQKKNEDLQELIEKNGELKLIQAEISQKNEKLLQLQNDISVIEMKIKNAVEQRRKLIDDLILAIDKADQSAIDEMKFGIEAQISDIETLQKKVK